MNKSIMLSNAESESSMKQVNFTAFIECLADLLIAEKDDKSIDKVKSE